MSKEVNDGAIHAVSQGGDMKGRGLRLKRIRSLGLEVAPDDFGTGCSSLSILTGLPLGIHGEGIKPESALRYLKVHDSFLSAVALIVAILHCPAFSK